MFLPKNVGALTPLMLQFVWLFESQSPTFIAVYEQWYIGNGRPPAQTLEKLPDEELINKK